MTYPSHARRLVLGTILAGLANLAATGGGRASMIPIANPGFDATDLTTHVGIADNTNTNAFAPSTPLTFVDTGNPTGDNASALGWTGTAFAQTGVRFASLAFPLGGDASLSAGFIAEAGPGTVSVSQTITGTALQASNVYTLGIDVGAESTTDPFYGTGGVNLVAFPDHFTVQLLAGSTVLATTSLGDPTGPAPATGGWAHWSLTYAAPATGVPAGDLEILISGSGFTSDGHTVIAHAEFDNVTLDVVPEPSTVAVILLGTIGLLRRRRV